MSERDATLLLPCPFCGGAVQLRAALWPSDGDVDGIIHAAVSDCGLVEFSIGTADRAVIAAWNRRAERCPTRDVLAKALRHSSLGLTQKTWTHLPNTDRAVWLARADRVLRFLAEHGLTLTRTDKETK